MLSTASYNKIPVKHCAARYRQNALSTGASFLAGPEAKRSCIEINNNVITANTIPPTTPVFTASDTVTNPAAKGIIPKEAAARSPTQI